MSEARNKNCALCGEPGHRYGVGDPNHIPDPIACVNSLMRRREDLEACLRWIRDHAEDVPSSAADAAALILRRLPWHERVNA